MVERIQTFVPGLDDLIQGGLPKGGITLVSGTPGTGKSILCAQVLFLNAKKGKKCLYLNLEQDNSRLENQMQQFGWDVGSVKKNLKMVSVDSSDPATVDYILSEIKQLNYDLIVLDSLDSISSTPTTLDENKTMGLEKIADSVIPTILDAPTIGRLKLKKIFSALAQSKATTILTSERVEGSQGISRDTISEFLSDGIIMLQSQDLADDVVRTMVIKKMRMTKTKGGHHSFEFADKGIELTRGVE